jgi:hypothetical protein
MSGMKSFTMLLAVGCICLIGIVSCNAEASLPELPYSQKLQETIDQVVSAYPEHESGISAAIIVQHTHSGSENRTRAGLIPR